MANGYFGHPSDSIAVLKITALGFPPSLNRILIVDILYRDVEIFSRNKIDLSLLSSSSFSSTLPFVSVTPPLLVYSPLDYIPSPHISFPFPLSSIPLTFRPFLSLSFFPFQSYSNLYGLLYFLLVASTIFSFFYRFVCFLCAITLFFYLFSFRRITTLHSLPYSLLYFCSIVHLYFSISVYFLSLFVVS